MLSRYHNVHYTSLIENTSSRRRAFVFISKLSGFALLITVITICGFLLYKPTLGPRRGPEISVPYIPKDFRTVGLVFYGRRSRVSILDCYLKRNLKENGGSLDEVIFVARTNNVEDLQWLDQLVTTTPGYSRHNLTEPGEDPSLVDYGKVWNLAERGTMYIKIDDDVVYIDNSTIPRLIASKAAHPEHILTSANGVNNPALSWVHYHLGVIRPYLPELTPPTHNASTWRASELPLWSGPPGYALHRKPSPPYKNHRWLPLGPEYNLDGTPITITSYSDHMAGWKNWAVVAQEHYSFLDNLERGEVEKYHFGMWDYQYERVSINLVAVWGDDVVDNLPFPTDDEKYLTLDLTKKLGRHAVIDGHAVAAHYAFRAQTKKGMGLEWTDVLERYRAYAQENVCYNVP